MKNKKSLEQLFELEVNARLMQSRAGWKQVSTTNRYGKQVNVNDAHVIKMVENPELVKNRLGVNFLDRNYLKSHPMQIQMNLGKK